MVLCQPCVDAAVYQALCGCWVEYVFCTCRPTNQASPLLDYLTGNQPAKAQTTLPSTRGLLLHTEHAIRAHNNWDFPVAVHLSLTCKLVWPGTSHFQLGQRRSRRVPPPKTLLPKSGRRRLTQTVSKPWWLRSGTQPSSAPDFCPVLMYALLHSVLKFYLKPIKHFGRQQTKCGEIFKFCCYQSSQLESKAGKLSLNGMPHATFRHTAFCWCACLT